MHEVEVGGIDFSVWRVKLEARDLKEKSKSLICRCFRRCTGGTCSLCTDEEDQPQETKAIHQKFYSDLNMGISIVSDPSIPTINEVKRTGFLIDRGLDLELRPGDTLVVYVSMGGFEK